MKVIAYLRVSTDRQAEDGLGLDVQEDAIRAWCRAQGHRLSAVSVDAGVSGSNGIGTRIGLAEALESLRVGAGAGLVVYRLDRLARDLIVQEQLLAELRNMGCQVFSTSAAETGYLEDDPDDPSRALIRQVLGAVSQYERSMVRLRLEAGRRRKAQRGGYAGYGSPPYGFRSEDGELVPDPEEQKVISLIRQLSQQGKSSRAIAMTLDAKRMRPRRAERWDSKTICKIQNRTA